jgi:hypothetical protein
MYILPSYRSTFLGFLARISLAVFRLVKLFGVISLLLALLLSVVNAISIARGRGRDCSYSIGGTRCDALP